MQNIDTLHAKCVNQLISPAALSSILPINQTIAENIIKIRKSIEKILHGKDPRLLVVIGPCSIHDDDAAIEYAQKLNLLRIKYKNHLEIVMRTHFEKPRTVTGWKGLITDPRLDGSFRVNEGLKIARKLLLSLNKLGMPTATEFLDIVISQYIVDLISWGTIGARTVESQIHREMASALSCPIGFKNSTEGNIQVAIDAVQSAKSSHLFLSLNRQGQMTAYQTNGNPYGHVIMRGGKKPNYQQEDIDAACKKLASCGLPQHLLVDFSHGNCQKQYLRQLDVARAICKFLRQGNRQVVGVMVESNLVAGSQKLIINMPLTYGQSVTDACLGWDDSENLLAMLNKAVSARF